MIVAGGARIGWFDLPTRVRAAVEEVLGDAVVEARTQHGGFSPGTADRVVTRGGRRAFVKAVGAAQNEHTIHLHRAEAAVTAGLPPSVPAPALLGVHDDGDWVALVLDDVDGRHPATPWDATELEVVMAAVAQVAAVEPEVGSLPPAGDRLADELRRWPHIAADPPPDLDPWARASLERLCALGDQAVAALVGPRLVHTDLRADNLLVRADGTVAVVDWPWAARGPAWLDALLLLVNVELYGGHDTDALVDRHVDAPRTDVDAVLAGLTGYFLNAARLPPPRGMPTVRAFQAAQGRTTLAWVRRRLTR